MTARIPKTKLRHLGIYCFDPEKLVPFYQKWFGMVISDRGIGSTGDQVIFMTADPEEHHQIAFATGRQPNTPGFNQVSFLVDSLEELVDLTRRFHEAGVPILQQKDHGNSWSLYVEDPEGNRLEIYCHTPWFQHQPTWWPLDMLKDSAETVYAITKARIESTEGTRSRQEWVDEITRRIEAQHEARNAEA